MKKRHLFLLLCGLWGVILAGHGRMHPSEPEVPASSCADLPDSIEFCGQPIDLTRFDRRERMDREMLAFTYMHSTSIGIIKRANRYFPLIEPLLAANGSAR